MNEQNEILIMAISSMAMLFMMVLIAMTTYLIIGAIIRKYKTKLSIKLINVGYSVLTADNKGVPHLLKRDEDVVTAWSAIRGK